MLHARFYSMQLIIIITIIILSFVYLWQYFITLKQIIQIKVNGVKNPNWPEANHFAIYKCGRGFELGTTVNKSSKRSEQDLNSGTPTCKSRSVTAQPRCLLHADTPALTPFSHAASYTWLIKSSSPTAQPRCRLHADTPAL